MDPKKYDSVVVLIASKNWTIWKHKWQEFNGQNVQLKVVHHDLSLCYEID